jgi:hypothetical protein
MKIFSNDKATAPKVEHATASGKLKGKPSIVKKELSKSEIREKLAANAEISDAAKAKASANKGPKLGEGFMGNDHVLKSDVQLNSPEDPVTAEKLKTVLSNGAFNFNPKERDVLSKILEG